jgi:hypothetical protein
MKKQYVVIRQWRGQYVETMCEPKTQKEAEVYCKKLSEQVDSLNIYKVTKIPTTQKKTTYL